MPRSGTTYATHLLSKYWYKKHRVETLAESEVFNEFMTDFGSWDARLAIKGKIIKLHTWGTPNSIIEKVLTSNKEVVAVERGNIYEQFVSWVISSNTDQWTLNSEDDRVVIAEGTKFDVADDEIELFTDSYVRYEFFRNKHKIRTVTYETIERDLKNTFTDYQPVKRVDSIKQNGDDRYNYVVDGLKERFDAILDKSRSKNINALDWMKVDNGAICAAPWSHVYIHPNGDVHPCCTALSLKYGNVNEDSLYNIWNGDVAKDFRQKLLNGEKQKACEFCYKQEEHSPISSLRQHLNRRYGMHVKDDDLEPDFKIRYLDIRSSNICNFKCVMCGPELSSSWHDDIKTVFNDNNRFKDMKKFIQIDSNTNFELIKNMNWLEEIYFAGGEPFITKQHYETLDWLLDNNKTDVKIRYNTNLSVLSYKEYDVLSYLKKFKNVIIAASIDLDGGRGEYQRYGLNWSDFLKNVRTIRNECPWVEIHPQITITALSIGYLPEFLTKIEENFPDIKKIDFNFNVVPPYFNPQIIPNEIKKEYTKKLTLSVDTFNRDAERDVIKSAISFLNQDKDDALNHFSHMREFLDRIDSTRGTDWRTMWPEFANYELFGDKK